MSIGTPKALKDLEARDRDIAVTAATFEGATTRGYRMCWEAVKPVLEKAAILVALAMRAAHRTTLSKPERAEVHGFSVELRDALEGLGLEE